MKKFIAVIFGAVLLSFIGFNGVSALTVDLNQPVGTGTNTGSAVNLNGVVNSAGNGVGTVNVPTVNPNANANGNINFTLDGNGNLIGSGSGILPNNVNVINGLLNTGLPDLNGSSGSNTQNNAVAPAATTNNGSTTTTTTTTQPIVVSRSNVAALNSNPFVIQQVPTSNGNGTIVYYYIVTNPNGVQSQDNLQNFTVHTVQSDPNMQSAAIGQNQMDLTYNQPAKLFGFIPTSVPVNVHINNDGTTTTNYPWYSFLMTKNQGALQSAIQAKVNSVLTNSDTAQPVNNVLSGNVNVPVSGSVTGNGSTSGNTNLNNVVSGTGVNNLGQNVNGTVQATDMLNTASPQTKAEVLDGVHSVLETNAAGVLGN